MAAWTSRPDVGADPRRAVDDARDGRPGDARHVGDLFQGSVAASVAAVWLCHSHSGPSVRALSRLNSTLARLVKRALSRSFGAVWDTAGVLERVREARPGNVGGSDAMPN